jgi:hypothetical protein
MIYFPFNFIKGDWPDKPWQDFVRIIKNNSLEAFVWSVFFGTIEISSA